MESDFFFRLILAGNFAEIPASHEPYTSDGDDSDTAITVFISELCERLSSLGAVDFQVGGFGLDDWQTDVWMDLAVVMEQFPLFLTSLQAGKNSVLDFYEQGLQRILYFVVRDLKITIECRSYSERDPVFPALEDDWHRILQMATDLLQDFIFVVKEKLPFFYEHSLFQDYLRLA